MFLFCLVFAMSLCASVYMYFVVTCWERADLLALVCGVCCELVTFKLVPCVRCDTWLYRFLIFAPLLTLSHPVKYFYWPFQGGASLVDHLRYLFLVFCLACMPAHCCLVVPCWERADLLALVCDVLFLFLPLSHVVSLVKCGTWL